MHIEVQGGKTRELGGGEERWVRQSKAEQQHTQRIQRHHSKQINSAAICITLQELNQGRQKQLLKNNAQKDS